MIILVEKKVCLPLNSPNVYREDAAANVDVSLLVEKSKHCQAAADGSAGLWMERRQLRSWVWCSFVAKLTHSVTLMKPSCNPGLLLVLLTLLRGLQVIFPHGTVFLPSVTNDNSWKELYTLVKGVKRNLHIFHLGYHWSSYFWLFHLFSERVIICWLTEHVGRLKRRLGRYLPRFWHTFRFPSKNLLKCDLGVQELNNFLWEWLKTNLGLTLASMCFSSLISDSV